ncbi:MAG: hypothetical protein LWX83_14845 [Anaerolineae bacterium]|nr:hypothetical protein [Anaerolineae bacterium]
MRFNLILVGLTLFQLLAAPLAAEAPITAANDQASLNFPENITFSVDLESSAEINDIVLEYGVDQLTCGTLVSKSFPDFEPGRQVHVEWSWPMKQSGSLPTGAKIWWRWQVKDANGNQLTTERQSIPWIDNKHDWKTLTQGNINLHWYSGGQTFGQELLTTAVNSLGWLDNNVGLKPDGAIDLYIYANSKDLSDTIYFQPDWTGGLAYPHNNIILIGISPDVMEWGRHAVTHELTHVLVGHYTFTCLGDVPTWLDEGLAKFSEGDWDKDSQKQLQEAVADNSLISVRSLSSSFPEDAAKANLAYTQSQSIVTFLINTYKQDKMMALLSALRDGTAIDPALQTVYGFDQDGLEDAWRTSMKAQPRMAVESTALPTEIPTPVPTIKPMAGIPVVGTSVPTFLPPTPQPFDGNLAVEATPTPGTGWLNPVLFTIIGLGVCVLALGLLVVLIVIIVLVVRHQKKKRETL